MSNRLLILFWGLLISLIAGGTEADTPTCKKLSGNDKALAKTILESQHVYDCCDDTIANCLKKKPTCALAYRLSENVCRRILEKQNKATIIRGLSRRARSMMSGNRAKIDLKGVPTAGDPNAPVRLVEYACPRCPYCSKITPKLYDAIVKGPLKGKVRLSFKTFPIRSHEFTKEAGLGFVAANTLGRFWEFLLYNYKHFDTFCVKKQSDWAEAVGLDRAAFERTVSQPTTYKLLVDSKKEGIINKVDATPTFFINGRKYVGDLNHRELVDVLEEEYEKLQAIHYRK